MSISNSNISASIFLFAGYLFLIGLSWFIQLTFPEKDLPNKYQRNITIVYEDEPVEVHYYSVGKTGKNSASLYFPDVYHGAEYLIPLAEADTSDHEKIIFDYPKEDINGNELSFSVESRSKIASVFLDTLGMENISIRGHGYGGLAAIELLSDSDIVKTCVKNLVLMSSFGVQELQFLGNYSFNRSIYSILHGATKSAEFLIPHMGYFYQQPIQDRYTKAMLAMDQREVSEQLKSLDLPVLIIHPSKDGYTSMTISKETHRLVPQSYFVSPAGNHKTYFSEPDKIARQLNWFTILTAEGNFAHRDNAAEERIMKSRENFNPDDVQDQKRSTLALLGFMIILIATLSEDLGAISAGLLVASGLLPFWFAIFVTILGIFVVDISIYLLGRYVGREVIERAPFRWFIKEKDIKSAENTFNMRGVEIIFISRFLPGARLPVYIVAGILKVKISFFLTYFFLAIIIWAPLLIGLSALVGEPILDYLNTYQDYALWVFLGLMFIIYIFIKLILPLTTLKGRQRLVIKWRRFRERFLE